MFRSANPKIFYRLILAGSLLCGVEVQAKTFLVKNTSDTGMDSLRQAILDANTNPGPDDIAFAIGTGPQTIALQSALPQVSGPLVIDGGTQPGYVGTPLIRLDGSLAGANSNGLSIFAADGAINALVIVNFDGNGIVLNGSGNTISGCYIGNDGSASLPNHHAGIVVQSAASNSVVGLAGVNYLNVISGNGTNGIQINASGAAIGNNFVGINAAGTQGLPNQQDGIAIYGSDNSVGSANSGLRNVISGNLGDGVYLGTTADSTRVKGNYIGTDRTGDAPVANIVNGVRVDGGNGVVVGGTAAGEGNLVSGNIGNGVYVYLATGTLVQGNRIGTNRDGDVPMGNVNGVAVYGAQTTIGGSLAGAGNLISGNVGSGIYVNASGNGTVIRGNVVGATAGGEAPLPNGSGIRVVGANAVQIGGSGATEGNLISGNLGDGVSISAGAIGAALRGNRIGTNLAGTTGVPNGVGISVYAPSTVIGGNSAGLHNLISGNLGTGIYIGAGSDGTSVVGNNIGTDVAGMQFVKNGGSGVRVAAGVNIRIGGTNFGQGNVISGNSRGIEVESSSDGTKILGNILGVGADGNKLLGNTQVGISIAGKNTTVGGASAAARNLISGNGVGLFVFESAQNLSIQGNYIGTDASGKIARPNTGSALRVLGGSTVKIGGSGAGEGNLVSGNDRGISLEGAGGYTVQGNLVGLQAGATSVLPNHDNGIYVESPGNLIGGTTIGAANTIAGNDNCGIYIDSYAAINNIVQGNWIGTTSSGASNLGNMSSGIFLNLTHGNLVGGDDPGAANTLAFNGFNGVFVSQSTENRLSQNSIHDNGYLGIENDDPQGPIPNDLLDADPGSNDQQNLPLLTSATIAQGNVQIAGNLASTANGLFRVEFFHSPQCDSSGLGEGAEFIGSSNLITDAAGNATIAAAFPLAVSDGVLSATATAENGSTSEFSPCVAVGAPTAGQLQFWRQTFLAYEGTPYVAISVVRSHGFAGAVGATLVTQDDSAVSPDDYAAQSVALTFAPGEFVKTVLVPLVSEDDKAELTEKFHVLLQNPTGGATLGAQSASDVLLFNQDEDYPYAFLSDGEISEPLNGTATMTFTLTLSATNHPVTLLIFTKDGTALAGQDFVAKSEQVTFAVGETQKTFSVEVNADDVAEGDERFFVTLGNVSGNWIAFDGLGQGLIHDTPSDVIFKNGFD